MNDEQRFLFDLQGFLALRDDVRRGFQEIRVQFRVKSQASDAQLNDLCLFAQQHSPVFDMVSSPTPIKVGLERIP